MDVLTVLVHLPAHPRNKKVVRVAANIILCAAGQQHILFIYHLKTDHQEVITWQRLDLCTIVV